MDNYRIHTFIHMLVLYIPTHCTQTYSVIHLTLLEIHTHIRRDIHIWTQSFTLTSFCISGPTILPPFLPLSFIARIFPGLQGPEHNTVTTPQLIHYPVQISQVGELIRSRIYHSPRNRPVVIPGLKKYVYVFTPGHFFEFIVQVARSIYEIMFEWSFSKMICV